MNCARLDRLAHLATIIKARDLARLAKLNHARQESAKRMAKLSHRLEITEDPALNAARLAHATWAQDQRTRLNKTLARQTAQVLDQKARTAQSVGRAMALEKLRKPAR